MSFLQPWLLWALPVAALPIIIHLINQRRYQTVRWGAMMFLLAANRMSRGYARLRQWLILLARVVTIVGLIFVISRPLASGWLGLSAGSSTEATLLLIDRSPSMQQTDRGSMTKQETGLRRLTELFATLRRKQVIEIDGSGIGVQGSAIAVRSIESNRTLELATRVPMTASADLPGMLEVAQQYLHNNRIGRADVWICSDLRSHDWQPESTRWRALRDSFQKQPQGIRFHLLALADVVPDNLSLRVTDVKQVSVDHGVELALSVLVTRSSGAGMASAVPIQDSTSASANGSSTVLRIPLRFDIGSARSELLIEITGDRFELKDHRIPLDRDMTRGWGSVSLPADANLSDNTFYFVFDEISPRHTLIVADQDEETGAIELAAAIAPESGLRCTVEKITAEQFSTVDLGRTGLVIWCGPLPEGTDKIALEGHVRNGRYVLFFPPTTPSSAEFQGVRWEGWKELEEPVAIDNWRGDQDLLQNTLSGSALPAGEIRVQGLASLKGDLTLLATVNGGLPLLTRAATERGGVYFCATRAEEPASSLATNGIVLYVLLHRALAAGSESLSNTQHLVAGSRWQEEARQWRRLAGDFSLPSDQHGLHAGVYEVDDRWIAVNRDPLEDGPTIIGNQRLAELFEGLDFVRVDDRAGTWRAMVEEIWRVFLIGMMAAMIVEAILCLPRTRAGENRTRSFSGFKTAGVGR